MKDSKGNIIRVGDYVIENGYPNRMLRIDVINKRFNSVHLSLRSITASCGVEWIIKLSKEEVVLRKLEI